MDISERILRENKQAASQGQGDIKYSFRVAMAYKDMTTGDIADSIGAKRQTVQSNLARGIKSLVIVKRYADALNCDVRLVDRETGQVY